MKRSLRQARETSDGDVELLCFACRRAVHGSKQQRLAAFFKASSNGDSVGLPKGGDEVGMFCSQCRRRMDGQKPALRGTGSSNSLRVLPQIARLRQYQRIASEQGVPFTIQESAAVSMMRQACITCGASPPTSGHGLTRLRIWPEAMVRPERGGFMGPYHPLNLAPCCGTCNLMKGNRKVRSYVEAARHIATFRAEQGDFGSYPHRFRNNTSKRSRSAYITASSTHTKTHAMSNETFARIVSRPCRYCGKKSDPPRHHNGLDRLDSACRVYTEETCDSCCGDCNVMKYTYSESFFIEHCLVVAKHNVGRESFVGDQSDDGDSDEDDDGKRLRAAQLGDEYQAGLCNSGRKDAFERPELSSEDVASSCRHTPASCSASVRVGVPSGVETLSARTASFAVLTWDRWDDEEHGSEELDNFCASQASPRRLVDASPEGGSVSTAEPQNSPGNPFDMFAFRGT